MRSEPIPLVPPEPPSGSGSGGPRTWEPPSPEALGRILTKYEITALLGRGGMGAVYQGRQLSLDRPVAVKILPPALEGGDFAFKERFKNEARAMAKLNHPGIVAIHDFGEAEGGLLYLVMEFIGGTDVAQMIAAQGRLPSDHAISIAAHVCDALAYAHERGIVHRDIKPANVMVGYDGVVKVADFGLAKMLQSDAAGLTQSGYALGSMHYMAPEATIHGAAVDHRADVYAVGVMLYHMLTGKVPRGIFSPPSQQVAGLDPRYDAIIAKAIQNAPDKRFDQIAALRAELDGLLTAPVPRVEAGEAETAAMVPAALPTRARPQRTATTAKRKAAKKAPAPPMSKRTRNILAGSGAAVFALIAGLIALAFRQDEPDPTLSGARPDPVKPPEVQPMARKPWPTGPNFKSAGRFRSWSSLPGDAVVDLSRLKEVEAVRQVHMRGSSGWVVLKEDGSVVALDKRVETTGVRRLVPGYADWFGMILEDGKLRAFNRIDGAVADPELARLPPVKDAYLAPFHRVALLEDGSLRVWGTAHDGTTGPGNPEWKVKPTLPEGKKAVALSSSDNSLAVKLDDGSLLVWSIDLGHVALPSEFAPGRIGNFSMLRGRLFASNADGSAPGGGESFSWDLYGRSGPPAPVGGGRRLTDFLPTGVGMLARTDDGGILDFFLRTPCPEIAESVPMIGPTKAAHVSLSLPHLKDVNDARLIWFDEGPVPSPSTAAPAGPVDWPLDSPNFRREGQFKVWSSRPNQKCLDLNKLRGVTDVVQVYQGSGRWVVLRANGETISSFDEADREGIRRLCPGIGNWFALVAEDGSVEIIAPETDPSHLRPPAGVKIADAFLSPSCFGLTDDGRIEVWGRNFDGKREEKNGEWKTRPATPAGVKAIAITHTEFIFAALLEDRSLLAWDGGGPLKPPAAFADLKFDRVAAAGKTIYGVVEGTGAAMSWRMGAKEPEPVAGLATASGLIDNGKSSVCFFTESGKPCVVSASDFDPGVVDPVLPHIDGVDPRRFSLYTGYDSTTKESLAFLLWYDGPGAE